MGFNLEAVLEPEDLETQRFLRIARGSVGALVGKTEGGRKVDLGLNGRLLRLIDGFHMVIVF